jgi:hypothetical protein
MASPSGGGDDRLLRCSRSRSETIRGCSASSQRTTSCVIVSPASSSRAGSPTVTRRPRPAGSGRLISRAVDGIGAGERHRRRRGPGRLGWRPLRRRDLRPGDWQRGRDLVEQALRHSGVNLEVSADAHIRGGRQSTTSSLVNVSAARVLSRRANSCNLIICSLILGLLMIHRNPRPRSEVPARTARATAANSGAAAPATAPAARRTAPLR